MSELEFWKDLGNIFDAVLNYQKKNVEFNNHFINPWIRLGNIFERQDQTNGAVQAYQRATEIDPDTTQNWVDLGDAQFKKGEYDEAIEAYRKAVILDPEAGWPLGNLALSLVTQGKIEEAIPLYKKSIDLLIEVKDKAICWNRLGNAYRKLNNYENAFLAFQKADQLDGENTGFNDKLDETPPSTPMIAPEEILEQMIVEQTLEEGEAESVTPEAVDESAEETTQLEVDLTTLNVSQVETADGRIALAPNMEMKVEESVEEVDLLLNETGVEEPAGENAVTEEETPLALHEKNFDILQIVENVIAKVEQAYAEQESSDADEVQAVEEISAEAELSAVSEESAQEVEAAAETNEEAVAEVETPVANEVSKETVQEVESIAETNEEVALEVEAPVASEEATREVESVAAEINEETALEVEATIANEVSEEKQVSEDAPRHIPTWLIMKDEVKAEEKASVAETKVREELAQIESVTTLSDISQEAAVSESVVNMDAVETYTDSLAAQLTTEPNLSEKSIPETADQTEGGVLTVRLSLTVSKGHAEREAEMEAQEMIAVEESAIAEESSTVVADQQVAELAYEEYLKDVVEPTNILTDHVDKIQSEAPITKVSKNGEVRIAMDTKNAHVWNELGNIYLNASACDDAIASYSKAIELDRHFAWPYSNLALAYVQKGRFAEAILLYQRGIELFISDKDKAITWNRLGNVYRRINDYNNAIAAYQTADELDPENATLSLRSSFGLLGNIYSDSKPAYVA